MKRTLIGAIVVVCAAIITYVNLARPAFAPQAPASRPHLDLEVPREAQPTPATVRS